MLSSLWKIGALLGVIGVGFLVLMQAQKGMTIGKDANSAEAFSEMEAIEELANLGRTEPDHDNSPVAGEAHGEPAAESASAQIDDPQTVEQVVSESDDLAASRTMEPTPTVALEPPSTVAVPSMSAVASDPTSPTVGDEDLDNPFATFSFANVSEPPPQSEPQPDPDAATESSPVEPQTTSPFVDLVDAVTGDSTEKVDAAEPLDSVKPRESTGPLDAAPSFDEFAHTADPVPSNFNPFADASEPLSAAEIENDPVNETEPITSIPEPIATVFPEDDMLAERELEEALDSDSQPEMPAGPMLMPPPSSGHWDENSPAEVESSTLSSQAALPSAAEPVLEQSNAKTPDRIEMSQVDPERSVPAENEPNPFLVFPGGESPSEPASPQPAPVDPPPDPTTPSVKPQEQPGRAWVGDDAPRSAPRDGVMHPDGTFEMTIKPRGRKEQRIVPIQHTEVQHTEPRRIDVPGGFNPFFSDPADSAAEAGAVPEAPATINDVPPHTPAASRPHSNLRNAVPVEEPQATPAALSASAPSPSGSLTPADYIGVGTVSAETPSSPQQAQLTIEKQAPADAVLGQDLIYSILVKNIGQSSAKNVVVEDLVPKGSELKGTDPQAQMTHDKTLLWQLGTMEPGAQKLIRIKVVPIKPGQLGSVATVSFEAAVASRTIITAPELKLEMQGPQEVRVGEQAPFVFTLTNDGSANASGVYIRSIIPPGFRHPAANEENDIEYAVGELPRGQSRQVELTLLAVATGDFQNRAILTADGDVAVESHQRVTVIPSRLKIHREGPASRFVGREARFTSTLTNESSETLQNILVTETVPNGLRLVQASDDGSFDARQRTVTWRIARLEPGGARRFQVIALTDQPGQIECTIQARDQRGDTAEATSRMTVAGFSSLSVDVANPGRPIPVGEEVALRLRVRNGGTAAANQVQTSIELPPELRFLSVRGPVRYSQQGNRIVFEAIHRIDVSAEQNFDIVLAAAQPSDDARVIVQLTSNELAKPLNEEESIVIFTEGE